jgi:hypothetical protein
MIAGMVLVAALVFSRIDCTRGVDAGQHVAAATEPA